MAARRIPQYEINAVNARLDEIIDDALADAGGGPADPSEEAYLRERIADLEADLDDKERAFTRRVQRSLAQLVDVDTTALSSLDRIALVADAGADQLEIVQVITSAAVPRLRRATEAHAAVANLEREALRVYGQLCQEIDEIAAEFGIGRGGISLDPDSVAQRFLVSGIFQVRDPRLGAIQVDPKTFVDAYGAGRLVDWIAGKWNARGNVLRPADRRVDALNNLAQRCETYPADVARQVRDDVASSLEVTRARVQDMVPGLVEVLSQRNMRAVGPGGDALRNLKDALREAFGVDIEIQVSEPQVDLDLYYAQLYDACNSPYGIDRAHVARLAEIVGVPQDVINSLNARGICEAALTNGF
jgi:hypothetical protein